MRQELLSRFRRPQRDERGAFLVIWALLATALFAMIAIVIDLGQLRQTRRNAQLVADLSALAAGTKLSNTPIDPRGACQDVFGYIRTNLTDLPTGTSVPCTNLPATCTAGNPALSPPFPSTAPGEASVTSGPYTISIRYPIPQSEILDSRFTTGIGARDGKLCQRLRVTIQRSRPTTFGGVVGVSSLTTKATAVSRASDPMYKRIPSLWLLDPRGCVALEISGTGTVVNVGDDPPAPAAKIPGVVTIDSDGTRCSGQQATLDASGGATLRVVPETGDPAGSIDLVALPTSATTCNASVFHDCDMSDFSGSPPNIKPFPERQEDRATRAPIDWMFDCKSAYPPYRVDGFDVPVDDCPYAPPEGTREAYITKLRQAMNPSGDLLGGIGQTPAGFTRVNPIWCTNPPASIPFGNWYFPCAPSFRVDTNVTFAGGNAVFDHGITVSAGKTLRFNDDNPETKPLAPDCLAKMEGCTDRSSKKAAYIFIRKGDLAVQGNAAFRINRTAVIHERGILNIGGSGSPMWTSPTEGPLDALAYWNETDSNGFSLSGGSSMFLDGIFFTPFAHPFTISGNAPATQQKAQFVSQQAKITGGGVLNVAPDAFRFAAEPPEQAILIR